MNAEIEHASPWGKNPGEKKPGQKKRIGSAAARAYKEPPAKPAPGAAPGSAPAQLALPPHEPPGTLENVLSVIALIVRWRSRTR
jgi:membrane protein